MALALMAPGPVVHWCVEGVTTLNACGFRVINPYPSPESFGGRINTSLYSTLCFVASFVERRTRTLAVHTQQTAIFQKMDTTHLSPTTGGEALFRQHHEDHHDLAATASQEFYSAKGPPSVNEMHPAPEKRRKPRKLILCFDGTGNKVAS